MPTRARLGPVDDTPETTPGCGCQTEAVILRPATAADTARILAWNQADVHFLAPLDQARLAYLNERAAAVEIIETPSRDQAGFVITFIEGSDYDSENYRWFSDHEPVFHYIDRIVIDPGARGTGLARQVYAGLAGRYPERPLVAEVNTRPANDASLAFHDAMGFTEVGRLEDSAKGVVLLRLAPRPASAG